MDIPDILNIDATFQNLESAFHIYGYGSLYVQAQMASKCFHGGEKKNHTKKARATSRAVDLVWVSCELGPSKNRMKRN